VTAVAVESLDPAAPDAGAVAHYGDPMREQRLLAESVGLVDRSHRGVLAVPGEERLSWLHNLTTQHLLDLGAGQATETLVLSPHGHVEHHAQVVEDGATTWLDTEPWAAPGLLDFLTKMRFLTRVEPRAAGAERGVLSVVGPGAAAALDTALGVPPLAPPDEVPVPEPKFRTGSVPSRPTLRYEAWALPAGGVVRRGRLGYDLLVPRASEVVDALAAAGVPRCGLWAYEALRVAARIPRVGIDTDHRTLPAEAGLIGPAVHLEKGCYRGQETVARVHHLGRPPRRMVLLHLDGMTSDQLPAAGTPVTAGERPAGVLGTAVHHAELGPIALAILNRRALDAPTLRVGDFTAAVDPPDPPG
jgi:folate-binding protein YgfZ